MEEESPMILPGIHFAYDVGDEPEEEDDEVRDSQSEDDDEDQDDILIVQGEEDYDDQSSPDRPDNGFESSPGKRSKKRSLRSTGKGRDKNAKDLLDDMTGDGEESGEDEEGDGESEASVHMDLD
jgi:hypothetical protein